MSTGRVIAGPTMDTPRARNLALALLAMTQFVIVIDASIVNVALPSIGRGLDFAQNDLSWVVNAYTLTFGGFLLLGGRLADVLGRRRMFIAGLLLFSVASLAGGLAQSEGWLIAARAVQGLGGAIVSPAALSIVTTTFSEGSERNRALGVWGAVAGAGGAAGVLLGGILTSGLSWRWVLFVNVPIGLLCGFPGSAAAGREPQRRGGPHVRRARRRHRDRGPGPVRLRAGGHDQRRLGRDLDLAADRRRRRAVDRLRGHRAAGRAGRWCRFEILRLRTLRGANIVGLLIGMSLFSMFYFISLYLQLVLHDSALSAGVSYLPLSIVIILSAGAASQLVNRLGFKPVLMFGQVCIAVGLVWFAQVSATGSFGSDVLGPSIIAAAGLGFSFVPVTIAALTGTSPAQAGLASGLINTSQQVGGALGLAILATAAGSLTRTQIRSGTAAAVRPHPRIRARL